MTDEVALAESIAAAMHDRDDARAGAWQLALLVLKGAPESRRGPWEAASDAKLSVRPPGRRRMRAVLDLVQLELEVSSPTRLAVLFDHFGRASVDGLERRLGPSVASTLLAHGRGEEHAVTAAMKSPFPELVAVAHALDAERRDDWTAAASYWDQAAAHTSDGQFLLLEAYRKARALVAVGDAAGVEAACSEVITPRVFKLGWAAYVGPCLLWRGEALETLGRTEEARASLSRLLALRSAAPRADPLIAGARVALKRLHSAR